MLLHAFWYWYHFGIRTIIIVLPVCVRGRESECEWWGEWVTSGVFYTPYESPQVNGPAAVGSRIISSAQHHVGRCRASYPITFSALAVSVAQGQAKTCLPLCVCAPRLPPRSGIHPNQESALQSLTKLRAPGGGINLLQKWKKETPIYSFHTV